MSHEPVYVETIQNVRRRLGGKDDPVKKNRIISIRHVHPDPHTQL